MDNVYKAARGVANPITEKIDPLNRSQRAPTAQAAVGDIAVVEADRDEPGLVRAANPHLLEGQEELLVLIAGLAAYAPRGEACEEYQGVFRYRVADFSAPVFARPQVGGVAPDVYPG